MHLVIYLRGLNSQGDDALRAGGLAFGPMHGPWLKELESRRIGALAVTGFGAGRLASQVERARQILHDSPAWKDPKNRFHLLGHSTGGLMARALAHELGAPERITSVTTLSTPHRGSPLVGVARQFSGRHPFLHQVFRSVNYDINQRLESFADLAPEAAMAFNQKYPDIRGIDYACVIFKLPTSEMGWPVRIAHRILDEQNVMRDHDGYVESESQRWGRVLAEMDLDHLGQIGFDFSLNPLRRRQMRTKFRLVADCLASHWQTLEAGGSRN